MKDIRIGNDINVTWSLNRNGQPFILDGLDVSLYLRTPFGKQKVEVFSTKDNKVLWTFYGKTQKAVGKYSLELIINEGTIGMVTTDACDLVNLVSCGCKVGGADSNGVTTEIIDLSTEVELFAPIVDDELSETSQNPIANYVVTLELKKKATKEELTKKQDTIADLVQIRENAAKGATALQSVPSEYVTENELSTALLKKVDAVEGKGLSTNDFTNAEKQKLSQLQNYDDSALRNEIKQGLAKKQDTIADLVQIRENAAKGATALQSVPSEYVTENELKVLSDELLSLKEMIGSFPLFKNNYIGFAYVGFAELG